MPAFALAVSLVVLSHSGIFIRFAQANAAVIGFWRMALVVPLLFALLFVKGQHRALAKLPARGWARLLACGFFLFAHWWSWFLAVQLTSLANSMVLFAISPIFTALGAWFLFRERVSKRHGVALGCCLAGVLALFHGSVSLDPAHLKGDILGLLASILFSAYVLASKGARAALANIPFTLITYSSSGLLFLGVILQQDLPLTGYNDSTWLAFLALAVGPTLLGHALFTWCLQFFNVNLMNILILTEPVIASVSAWLILHEPLNLHQVVGFAAIATGVVALFAPLPRLRKRS